MLAVVAAHARKTVFEVTAVEELVDDLRDEVSRTQKPEQIKKNKIFVAFKALCGKVTPECRFWKRATMNLRPAVNPRASHMGSPKVELE